MWCKGSTNDAGVAAWIDCNVTASLDPATTAASIAQSKEKNGWSDYNLDFIYSQTTLDGTSKLTPIFDFKNGLGTDIASADTADSNVEQLTKYFCCIIRFHLILRHSVNAVGKTAAF